MLGGDSFTEEVDGAQVLGRLGLDRGGDETLRGVMENQQLVVIDRDGPKKPTSALVTASIFWFATSKR